MKTILLLTFTIVISFSNTAQVISCLSGAELTAYNQAPSGELIEVTESQYVCIAGLSNLTEIGVPSNTIIANLNSGAVFSGEWTEVYSPTNAEGLDVGIPANYVMVGFVFTNSDTTNTVGPRVSTSGDYIIKPHNNDITVNGVGDKFFILKDPSIIANETTFLGMYRTGYVYTPYDPSPLNYRFVRGGPVGSVSFGSCNCKNLYLSALISPMVAVEIGEEVTREMLSVYPNPTSNGEITLDIKGFNQVEIRIVDLSGKVVFHEQSVEAGLHALSLDVLAGYYFVEVISNQSIYRSKFVVE
jgi:hypothetical protein